LARLLAAEYGVARLRIDTIETVLGGAEKCRFKTTVE
jgi:hypothetical protein